MGSPWGCSAMERSKEEDGLSLKGKTGSHVGRLRSGHDANLKPCNLLIQSEALWTFLFHGKGGLKIAKGVKRETVLSILNPFKNTEVIG